MSKLAAGSQDKLTIRLQGPYADPPAPIGQPDGVILVAGKHRGPFLKLPGPILDRARVGVQWMLPVHRLGSCLPCLQNLSRTLSCCDPQPRSAAVSDTTPCPSLIFIHCHSILCRTTCLHLHICTAGGNGIASALPVFEELSAAGVKTQGLPALLVWACRKGHEFEFMAAPVLAAAQALGLKMSVCLHVTGAWRGWCLGWSATLCRLRVHGMSQVVRVHVTGVGRVECTGACHKV